LEGRADNLKIREPLAPEPASTVARKIGRLQNDQSQSVSGNQFLTSAVVDGPLLPAVYAADRQPVRFVEVRHGPVMLNLAVLNDQSMSRPVSINRQTNSTAPLARVTEQPIEPMLT
jgi:hypothetical protein